VKEGRDEEADSLSTPCSLCHMSLDIYQGPARRANTSLKLPILHLPQLRGLAMGIQAMDLMFSRHLGRWIRPVRTVEIRRTAQKPVYATCILSSQDTSKKAMYTETRTWSTWYWEGQVHVSGLARETGTGSMGSHVADRRRVWREEAHSPAPESIPVRDAESCVRGWSLYAIRSTPNAPMVSGPYAISNPRAAHLVYCSELTR
jgi:hypothetical protein